MERTTVYLTEEIQRGLRSLARRTGTPQAELIREALSEYLERQARPSLPSWVGSVTDGPVTDSSTIKQEMRERWDEDLKRERGWEDP